MNILSVTAYNTESCVVLSKHGKIVSAAYEEHFSRISGDRSFPKNALRHVLSAHETLDAVLFCDKNNYKRFCADMRSFSSTKPELIDAQDALTQSAAIVYKSNCAAVIAVNALDKKRCISLGYYNGLNTTWLKHIEAPNCLYSLYSSVVSLLGLQKDKHVMLAARRGKPLWKSWAYDNLVNVSDSDIQINSPSHFGTAFLDYSIASTAQSIIQEIFAHLADWLHSHLDTDNLLFCGNFSDNTDLITYLYKNSLFSAVHTTLSPNTSSCAIGAIGLVEKPLWKTVYLGLEANNAITADEAAFRILKGDIVPIIQGKTEFSTSSFGNRCFLSIPSEQNINKLDNILSKPDWEPYNVLCQEKEVHNFFEVIGDTRYRQATADVIKSNYNVSDKKTIVQTVNITSNAYINRILEKTRQHGFPLLLCADLRLGDKPLINNVQDYNNEIQLYN